MTTPRLVRSGFLAWGASLSAVVKLLIPESPLGTLAVFLAMWAAFYPFVTTTTLPIAKYWLMLALAAPIVAVLSRVEDSVPYRAEMTVAVLTIAVAALLFKRSDARGAAH